MRLATVRDDQREVAAVVTASGALPVSKINEMHDTSLETELFGLIKSGQIQELRELLSGLSNDSTEKLFAGATPHDQVTYGPLYRHPRKIWGIGLNYVEHASDLKEVSPTQEPASFMRLDVLITNAGGPPAGNFDKFSDEDWQGAFELNLLSVVRLIRAALPHMREKGYGRIVNFTSSSIKQPLDNLILSNVFRTGVLGLSKSLSAELAPDGILINTLGPGRIATDRLASLDETRAENQGVPVEEVRRQSEASIPLGRYGQPDEFARVATFLASEANTYVTGQALLADGGMVRAL